MSEPEDILLDAIAEEYHEQIGREYFSDNWYDLIPKHARETILANAAQERTRFRGPARIALTKADEALRRGEPAVAYFHVRRAVEGYIGAVLVSPIFEFLKDALGTRVPLFSKPMHSILREGFIRDLKGLALRVMADDTTSADSVTNQLEKFFAKQRYRNDTFHSLLEPEAQVVADLRVEAERVLDQIDTIVPRETRFTLSCKLEEEIFEHSHGAACYTRVEMD
jgi:HEPN domain-containing protein